MWGTFLKLLKLCVSISMPLLGSLFPFLYKNHIKSFLFLFDLMHPISYAIPYLFTLSITSKAEFSSDSIDLCFLYLLLGSSFVNGFASGISNLLVGLALSFSICFCVLGFVMFGACTSSSSLDSFSALL